jgi:protein tyrosine/serine phosphatase
MFTLSSLFALGCGGQTGESSPSDTAAVNLHSKPAALKNANEPRGRNPKWAAPIDKPGLPNLHEVAPNVYRGAQPLPEGFGTLKRLGVKTVINFRNFHSDNDDMKEGGVEGAFQYIEIPMNTWDMTDARAATFLRIVEDEKNLPVFYHCQHGADRTGTMTAVYRIAHQGWTVDEALNEMQNGGFGYHEIWTNLISYLKSFDVQRVRELMRTI